MYRQQAIANQAFHISISGIAKEQLQRSMRKHMIE
jgi:hypothetical protein